MKYLLSEIAAICGGRLYDRDMTVETVSTDSRTYAADAGTLFVAINGVNHDAHDHIGEMYGRGVRAFMVERHCDLSDDCGAVEVVDSVAAIQMLAAHRRSLYRGEQDR